MQTHATVLERSERLQRRFRWWHYNNSVPKNPRFPRVFLSEPKTRGGGWPSVGSHGSKMLLRGKWVQRHLWLDSRKYERDICHARSGPPKSSGKTLMNDLDRPTSRLLNNPLHCKWLCICKEADGHMAAFTFVNHLLGLKLKVIQDSNAYEIGDVCENYPRSDRRIRKSSELEPPESIVLYTPP